MTKDKESLTPVALWVATVIFAAVFASGGGHGHGKPNVHGATAPATVIGSAN